MAATMTRLMVSEGFNQGEASALECYRFLGCMAAHALAQGIACDQRDAIAVDTAPAAS